MLSTVTAVGGGQGLFCAFNTPDNRHPKDIKQNSNTLFIIKQIDNQHITIPIHLSHYYLGCKNTLFFLILCVYPFFMTFYDFRAETNKS